MPNSEFNLIKQELVNEIRGMRVDMNRYFEKTEIHEKVLFGDKFKEPGMTEDVRTLKKLAGLVASSVAGFIGLFGEFIFRTFFHHSKGGG